ncbi:MAG: sulfatase [Bryobacteraceae bacterium]
MNRRSFLGASPATALLGARKRTLSGRRPNIVMIVADDLGYGDLGCYGSRIRTPNLDRLASDGMRFTDFYSASSVCSPSRAALLTGRYPVRTGMVGVLQAADRTGLPDSETTVARMLRMSGYRSACIGKWHLGSRPEFLPTRRGFDEYFGVPYSNDMWPLTLMRNLETVEELPDSDQLTQRYTEEAVGFINRSKAQPFFLYLAPHEPHIPIRVSSRFRNTSHLGLYGDAVEELDWSAGEILAALSSNDVAADTLVLFLSDNGPWYQGSRGGLKGNKGESFEGGFRVPFLARLPGRIPPGHVCSAVTSTMDILPTLAQLCGADLPDAVVDGLDISDVLFGINEEVERGPLLYFDGYEIQCSRQGKWKMHFSRYSRLPWSSDGPRVNLPVTPELYDLELDPAESYDCAGANPFITSQMRVRVEQMVRSFPPEVEQRWRDTMSRRVEYTPAGALPVESRP